MLRTVFHRGNGQHFGPYLEKEFADGLAHRHVIEHIAHLNGVPDGHGLLLLDLLGHADHARCTALLREKLGEKPVKFIVNQLKYPAPGFGVLLDHLDDTLDFDFQRAARHRNFEAEDTGTHPVNQPARRML